MRLNQERILFGCGVILAIVLTIGYYAGYELRKPKEMPVAGSTGKLTFTRQYKLDTLPRYNLRMGESVSDTLDKLNYGYIYPSQRYFFIGYTSNSGTGGAWLIRKDGKFPDYEYCIEEVRRYFKFQGKIAITSIYEFKNKAEYETFISTYN